MTTKNYRPNDGTDDERLRRMLADPEWDRLPDDPTIETIRAQARAIREDRIRIARDFERRWEAWNEAWGGKLHARRMKALTRE